jgi:hypothetical protein
VSIDGDVKLNPSRMFWQLIKFASKSLVVMFAVFGLFRVVADYVLPSVHKNSLQPELIKVMESPSGNLKAVLLGYAGGGGFAPFCYDRVAIVQKSATDIEAQDLKYQVFRANCDDFSDGTASPTLEWISETHLRITASIHRTGVFPATILVRGKDRSGTTSVELTAFDSGIPPERLVQ